MTNVGRQHFQSENYLEQYANEHVPTSHGCTVTSAIAADGCLMDWLLSFQEHWEKIMEERGDTITHRAAYLKSCLWKWLEDSDAETLTKIQAA